MGTLIGALHHRPKVLSLCIPNGIHIWKEGQSSLKMYIPMVHIPCIFILAKWIRVIYRIF